MFSPYSQNLGMSESAKAELLKALRQYIIPRISFGNAKAERRLRKEFWLLPPRFAWEFHGFTEEVELSYFPSHCAIALLHPQTGLDTGNDPKLRQELKKVTRETGLEACRLLAKDTGEAVAAFRLLFWNEGPDVDLFPPIAFVPNEAREHFVREKYQNDVQSFVEKATIHLRKGAFMPSRYHLCSPAPSDAADDSAVSKTSSSASLQSSQASLPVESTKELPGSPTTTESHYESSMSARSLQASHNTDSDGEWLVVEKPLAGSTLTAESTMNGTSPTSQQESHVPDEGGDWLFVPSLPPSDNVAGKIGNKKYRHWF
jgi:hypothetical protein